MSKRMITVLVATLAIVLTLSGLVGACDYYTREEKSFCLGDDLVTETWEYGWDDGAVVSSEIVESSTIAGGCIAPEVVCKNIEVCIPVVVDPQWVDCNVPLADWISSISLGADKFILGTNVVQFALDKVSFANGDLMKALAASNTPVHVVLKNGEKLDLMVTPGIGYGYSNGCFIKWSSTWKEEPKPGTITIAQGNTSTAVLCVLKQIYIEE